MDEKFLQEIVDEVRFLELNSSFLKATLYGWLYRALDP